MLLSPTLPLPCGFRPPQPQYLCHLVCRSPGSGPPVVPATPSPAAVPEVASGETADVVQAAAEQSFAELGLGSYTPVGLIQNLLEFMHVDLGLPWWGPLLHVQSLPAASFFPLIVMGQREAAKIHNHLPEIQKFSSRIREAKLAGDDIEFYKASSEMAFYQKNMVLNSLNLSFFL